ncbi:MAG: TonB-dependent receptor [candidate division NC10 bacterium]|nr:TonB-dependent receptor [candidate division NC10 bacterium]
MGSNAFRTWLLCVVVIGLLVGAASAQEKSGEEKTKEQKTNEGEEVVQLPRVTVSTTRLPDVPLDLRRYPGQVRSVTEKEIETSGADTVPEIIKTEPGITLYNLTGNSFEPTLDMRGFSGEPITTTTVILDGVRVNNPGLNSVDWSLIPVKDLQGIQVIPGTQSIFGRNTLAGVVNLQTKRGGPVPEATFEVAGGSFGHQRYRGSVGGPVGDFDYYLGFTQELADGFRDDSDSDVTQFFTKVGRRIGNPGTDVTLSYLFVDDSLGRPGSLTEAQLAQDRTQSANLPPGDSIERTLHAGTLNVRQNLPAGFSVALNAFIRNVQQDSFDVFLSGGTSQTKTDITTGGGIAQVTHEATPFDRRNVFVVGVEYTQSDTMGTDSGTFPSDQETDGKTLGVFFQDSFDLIPEVLILSAGGRYDYDRIDFSDKLDPTKDRLRTFGRFNPMAGLTWVATNPDPEVVVYFSYSEGSRSPTVNELFAFAPFSSNPTLEAPTSRTFELGTRVRVGESFQGTMALFQTDVKDEILFVPTGPFTGMNENVDETRRRGVELTLRGRYGELVDGFVNYSYIQATFETDALLVSGLAREGNDIPLVPRNRVGWGVNVYPIEGLTVSLTGLYVGSQFLSGDEANQGQPLPAYYVMNGKVRYRWGPLTLFLQGNNITNSEYETWGLAFGPRFMPAPGISFLAGAVLELSGFYE